MESLPANVAVNVQDVYTDLHSLNSLKTEKNSDIALKKVAQEFESIFVNIMLKSMRSANAVFEKDSLMQSNESKMYRDMYDQQLALSLSKGRGLGIADALYKQLKGQYGEASEVAQVDLKMPAKTIDAATPVVHSNTSRSQNKTSLANSLLEHSAQNVDAQASTDAAALACPIEFSDQQSFIDHLLPAAERVAEALGLDPLLMVAQAALETGWGKHVVKDNNGPSFNLFNIKAGASWSGDSVAKNTLEYKEGVAVQEPARFRKYSNFQESMEDFVNFVQQSPRYEKAVELASDAKAFISELQNAGYATDPKYSDKVLAVFNQLQSMIAGRDQG